MTATLRISLAIGACLSLAACERAPDPPLSPECQALRTSLARYRQHRTEQDERAIIAYTAKLKALDDNKSLTQDEYSIARTRLDNQEKIADDIRQAKDDETLLALSIAEDRAGCP